MNQRNSFLLSTALVIGVASCLRADPLPGQIIIDPDHPQWLMRHGGDPIFICGPGDPEGFLYLGERRDDGTRDGPQAALIDKLITHGGNCIYLQLVRSHGGDGRRDENPFVDTDPAKGLDEDILNQWDQWFSRMDEHQILVYLFIYDDGARPFGSKADMASPQAEKDFVRRIVERFKRYRNLIWVIGEESEEAYSHERVRDIAALIQDVDDHRHLIGTHHQSSLEFKAWKSGGPLNHYAMQLTRAGDEAHRGAKEAFRLAEGKYQVIYSETTAVGTDPDAMRQFAWAAAMGGTMPMLLGMDIENTPNDLLQQCRHVQEFFESTDFYTMSPHDELAHAGSKWVLADPKRSYIAYAHRPQGGLGIKGMFDGEYDLLWLDCTTGQRVDARGVKVFALNPTWNVPEGIGDEIAVWVRPAVSELDR